MVVEYYVANYIYMGTKLGPLGLWLETSDLPLGTQEESIWQIKNNIKNTENTCVRMNFR
jgi:hypothetical protein